MLRSIKLSLVLPSALLITIISGLRLQSLFDNSSFIDYFSDGIGPDNSTTATLHTPQERSQNKSDLLAKVQTPKLIPTEIKEIIIDTNSSVSFEVSGVSLNSMSWTKGNRISNIDSEDFDFVLSQILDTHKVLLNAPDILLNRTVCHPKSQLRNPFRRTSWNVTDQVQVKEWTLLLLYLAIHSFHHEPAREEALLRKKNQQKQKDIGIYDYECPNAKFIITGIPNLGLGAALRMSAVNALLTGVGLNRVNLFLSNVNSTKVPEMLSEEFIRGGCSRGDLQCAFLPTSPCVVTLENVEHDMLQPQGFDLPDMRLAGRTNNLTLQEARFIYLPTKSMPSKDRGIVNRTRWVLYEIAETLVDSVRDAPDKNQSDMFPVLDEALRRIKENDFEFDGLSSKSKNTWDPVRQAAMLYLLRMHNEMERQVDAGVQATLPAGHELSSSFLLGLPIRASDKCRRESTCLSFDTYMQLTNETFREEQPSYSGSSKVMITTEDSNIANASRDYRALSIIMNNADVHQNTGRPGNYKYKYNAGPIMTSSLIALKLQMYPQRTFGNCCSNFHRVLFDLLESDCGLSERRECLSDHPNPDYRVCCGWMAKTNCGRKKT